MDLHRLHVFTKVYEFRSFSRAADVVLLSQPTVSGHIKILEQELGVSLFDRLGREILPTRVADLLYGHAVSVLEKVEQASMEIDAFLSRFRGELKLGGSTIPGQYLLPRVMGVFKKRHPEVRLSLSVSGSTTMLEQVLTGELDMGVIGVQAQDDRLNCETLWEDTVVLAAPPGHPFTYGAVEVAALAQAPMVMRESGSGTLIFVLNALKNAGLKLDQLRIEAQMGSNEAVLQGIKAGLGIGFASHRAMQNDLETGRLVRLNVTGLKLERSFYMVYRNERTHSPAAQAFMDLCRQENGS